MSSSGVERAELVHGFIDLVLTFRNNSFVGQLLCHPVEVGGVWITIVGWATRCVRFMVNTVPNNAIIATSDYGESDSKRQFASETLDKQGKYLSSLSRVRQVAPAAVAIVGLASDWMLAPVEAVLDDPGVNSRVSVTAKALLFPCHLTFGHVSCSYTVRNWADSAFQVVSLAHLHLQAL